MSDQFQNFLYNALNGTVGKLKGSATTFENKLKTFSDEVGGTFSLPQGKVDADKFDSRFKEFSGTLSSLMSLPMVEVPHKHCKIFFAGWWMAPPPVGPLILVSMPHPLRPPLKLSLRTKQRFDFGKLLAGATAPTDKALREFVKNAMPNFHYPDLLASELNEGELWMALPAQRTGIIEIDNVCSLFASDSTLGKKIFSDWQARESYLRIAKQSDFSINGHRNMTTLLLRSDADSAALHDCLNFFKSLIDRIDQLDIAR